MNPDKKESLIRDMINKELSFVDKTIDDVKDDPKWFENNTMNDKQFDEWKSYCMDILRKKFKYTKARAEYEFSFLNLNWGLKIDNEPKP